VLNVVLTVQQAVKLGSIVVHADELTTPGGHEFDATAIRSLLADPDVKAFLTTLGPGMLPVKRSSPPSAAGEG
jgi:hypothetical protein